MKTATAGTMPPRLCPAIEVLLQHERTIVPHVAIVRARALARAREAVRTGERMVRVAPSMPGLAHRFLFGAAAGITLLASAAAAYQLLRHQGAESALRSPASVLVRAAQVQSVPPQDQAAPRTAAKPAAAPAEAPARDVAGKPAAGVRATAPAGKEEVLGEELHLLERAQQSAAHGDYAAVLVATGDHERRFPAGRLCEEREALRLRALIGLGRDRDARLAASGFRRAFPHSVFLPKLEDMLASTR